MGSRGGLGGGEGLSLQRGAAVVLAFDPTVGHAQHGVMSRIVTGLAKTSFGLIDQLRSVDKRHARRVYGAIAPDELSAIDEGLAVFLGLGDRLYGGIAPELQWQPFARR